MALYLNGVLSITILSFICRSGVSSSVQNYLNHLRFCQHSPIDFIKDSVRGRATLSLPPSLVNLTLTVEMSYHARGGIKVLQLKPGMLDEKKCVGYPNGPMQLCYEYSEVHWGKTLEEGSDHSINGYSYPMEVQHYFHRTNLSHSLTPWAVGVLFNYMEYEYSVNDDPSPRLFMDGYDDLFSFHEMYPHFMKENKRLTMNLGGMLPQDLEGSPFYQYRAPVSGTCGGNRDWMVFEDPLMVFSSFLDFLWTLSVESDVNHFSQVDPSDTCILYSHYPSNSDGDPCQLSKPTGEKPPRELDVFEIHPFPGSEVLEISQIQKLKKSFGISQFQKLDNKDVIDSITNTLSSVSVSPDPVQITTKSVELPLDHKQSPSLLLLILDTASLRITGIVQATHKTSVSVTEIMKTVVLEDQDVFRSETIVSAGRAITSETLLNDIYPYISDHTMTNDRITMTSTDASQEETPVSRLQRLFHKVSRRLTSSSLQTHSRPLLEILEESIKVERPIQTDLMSFLRLGPSHTLTIVSASITREFGDALLYGGREPELVTAPDPDEDVTQESYPSGGPGGLAIPGVSILLFFIPIHFLFMGYI